MKKWYKEPYFDAESWIIENNDKLNLNAKETLALLLIVYCHKHKVAISTSYLAKKLSASEKEIDKLLADLVGKHYLLIKTNSRGIDFDISGIFEFDPASYEIAAKDGIYGTLEMVMNRPLNSTELQKLSDLTNKYSDSQIIEAIRVAEAYEKVNIAYIEGILRNEKK